jgi:hypothetical protein
MTKQQLKEKYLEWNREIGKLDTRKDVIFREMQELNAQYGDGKRWCSIQTNYEGIVKNTKDNLILQKCFNLISERSFIEGEHSALMKLALATNNFQI